MNIRTNLLRLLGTTATAATSSTAGARSAADSLFSRARTRTCRRLVVPLLAAATASLGLISATPGPAGAAVLQPPSVSCNPYHGQVVVDSGVRVSESAGDGAYAILLYRWTSTGWQTIASSVDYAPASFSVTTTRTFPAGRGIYGAYVRQVSGSYVSAWRWTGSCSMG